LAPDISLRPIQIDDEPDGDGQLILVGERLAGVLVRLDRELHGEHGGGWFLEAGFGRLSNAAGTVVFVTLAQALEWLDRYLRTDSPLGRRFTAKDRGDLEHRLTIVVVEDDAGLRLAMTETLEVAGYRVLAFANHVGALEAIGGAGRADVLVTDIMMPGHANGFALARMARLCRPTIMIVYTTGREDLPAAELRTALGPILLKPFLPEDLVRAVEARMAVRSGEVGPRTNRPDNHFDDASC
jgi:CheY-like chemotaxis protein